MRKAISRYGTLPKGARIGAYLDSLRSDDPDSGIVQDADEEIRKSSLPQPKSKSSKPVRLFIH